VKGKLTDEENSRNHDSTGDSKSSTTVVVYARYSEGTKREKGKGKREKMLMISYGTSDLHKIGEK